MNLIAFVFGMTEFRSDVTMNMGNHQSMYEQGRQFAHVITFRHFES